jgi:hypothetical protein
MCTPVIPALGRLRQEYDEFQASLDYITKPCLKKRKQYSYLKRKCLFFKNREQEDKTGPAWGLAPVEGGRYKERV